MSSNTEGTQQKSGQDTLWGRRRDSSSQTSGRHNLGARLILLTVSVALVHCGRDGQWGSVRGTTHVAVDRTRKRELEGMKARHSHQGQTPNDLFPPTNPTLTVPSLPMDYPNSNSFIRLNH